MSVDVETMGKTWEDFRQEMPISRQWAYFDNAAVAPICSPAQKAIEHWCRQTAYDGDTVWGKWCQGMEQTRRLAATLIGAEADEIALVPNTTTGICLVAEGYPWKDGDNVVLPANEFPTNLYPWLNLESRGVQTRRVPVDGVQVDLDRIAEACDSRTRIISLSWVGYATGWRIDIERLVRMAHDKGILVFLDAIQGLGVFPLDVRRTPVDFLAADGHKWLLGPEGAGIFYVRRDHLDLLRPLGVGWNSVVHRHDFTHLELDVRREAARYEGGTQNTAGFLALGASLELLMRFGTSSDYSAIAERILEITDVCCERLREIGAAVVSCRVGHRRSGIVAFEMPEMDPEKVRRRCLEKGVVISNRNGRLRISPHAYTNDEDIDRLVSAIVPLG